MVAKTPEGISLENLSKRASVYIDPDCDLYLEIQYLQSRAEFNKCTCFDLSLLAPGKKPNLKTFQDVQSLIQQGKKREAKLVLRENSWPTNSPIRSQLWPALCTQHHVGKTMLDGFYWDMVNQVFGTTELPEKPIMLPPFVDSTHCLPYHLTRKGRAVADRVVGVLGYACPDITYSPSLYPITAILLHFMSDAPSVTAQSDRLVDLEADTAEQGECSYNTSTGRTRKRVRRSELWKRNLAKRLRNSGQSYVDRRGKQRDGKTMLPMTNHACRFQCSTFSEEDRKKIFDDYWRLGSWNLQTSFVVSAIETRAVKKRRTTALNRKTVAVRVKLMGKRVCKLFLLKTLGISQKRYDNILKKRQASGVSGVDMRGKHTPSNKITDVQIDFIREHIESFPKFQSHYSREHNNQANYLSPSLNIRKMYELYRELCEQNNRIPVKESFYRHIFNTRFNLRFKLPYTDTCMTCDNLENKIKNDSSPEVVEESRIQKEKHLKQVEITKLAKHDAKQLAKNDPSRVRTICFDLEKTLPTPMLSTSIVFYSRQLWTYNFGIHDLGTNEASMFMWHEGEGGRGSQEIGSCLLQYAQGLPSSTKHLIAFSDNCGGQNKNHNIIKYWMHIISKTKIETIDHKFLISGHSYMECDQDFGIIEKSKKRQQYVFVPNDWVNIVKAASKKFRVVRMRNESFKPIENMQKVLDHKPIKGIRAMQWFRIQKSSPFTLLFKNLLDEDVPFQEVDMKQTRKKGRPTAASAINLDRLYNDSLPIKFAKYKDLQKLLNYLPPINHDFYKTLKHTSGKRNQNVGSNTTEIEEDFLTDYDSE